MAKKKVKIKKGGELLIVLLLFIVLAFVLLDFSDFPMKKKVEPVKKKVEKVIKKSQKSIMLSCLWSGMP